MVYGVKKGHKDLVAYVGREEDTHEIIKRFCIWSGPENKNTLKESNKVEEMPSMH